MDQDAGREILSGAYLSFGSRFFQQAFVGRTLILRCHLGISNALPVMTPAASYIILLNYQILQLFLSIKAGQGQIKSYYVSLPHTLSSLRLLSHLRQPSASPLKREKADEEKILQLPSQKIFTVVWPGFLQSVKKSTYCNFV